MKLPDYPALSALPGLRTALAEHGAAVLAAPPGSGKTTTIPLALLDEPWLAGKKIVMLQPRRIAARASAARMAHLLGEKVGERVGYQIRFDRRIGKSTRIEVLTEGLLARRLQSDPELPGVGLVIFDEFHERSLDADLALALTLDARANLNPSLRVLVMSATLDSARVSDLLDDAPIIEASGRLHPVDVRYLSMSGTRHGEVVANGVLKALAETQGDVLAFLPGGREIRDAERVLRDRARTVGVFPLYGDLSGESQDAALAPSRDGTRKVILATNIAQTSLTVEGVTTVVDGGFVRVARFDLGAGANRLDTERVSRASADQRAGRAGRLGPGVCYRLWSKEQHGALPAHDTPEMLSADLSRFGLELAGWGTADPTQLAFLDAPPKASWSYAASLLRELAAIDERGRITAHGREMARLPTSPRRAHMLLLAKRAELGGVAAWIAALLEESRDLSSDVAAALRAAASGDRRVRQAAEQLARLIETYLATRFDDGDIARIVAWSYPERIARRRGPQQRAHDVAYLCEDGGEARIASSEVLSGAEWLAIAHWDPGPPRKVRVAAAIGEIDVMRDHAERIRESRVVRWDPQGEAVVAELQRSLGAIVLERKPVRDAGDATISAMLDGVRALGLQALPWTASTRQWQARVMSLRTWRAEESWPDVSDDALLRTLDQWLAPHLSGLTRRDHLARLDLGSALNVCLDYAMQRNLARLTPTHVDVPSGSHIALEYFPDGRPPALEVKLQEMFGCVDTPRVNDGRTKVVVHLLSPAKRPLAVTQDLAGFWARTYAEVKKEMKGRYPRHPWPDDPLAAAPTRRAKPRGT
jgi:ATP-dependent helicase HrpB